MKKILCTVTNDLVFDQRMIRICTALQQNGWEVTLVGRLRKHSVSLSQQPYKQVRIPCRFDSGPLFYLEYNYKLWRFLKKTQCDILNAIDLDTLLPAFWVSKKKNMPLVYDAHEYFPEMPELVDRPFKKKMWLRLERYVLPKIRFVYTVTESIARHFEALYPQLKVSTIRNLPTRKPLIQAEKIEGSLLYQGDVNMGRGIEESLLALSQLPEPFHLIIAGDGYFLPEVRKKVFELNLQDRVQILGKIKPDELANLTAKVWLGLNLLENKGLNYYFSLANKFSDYIQAGKPQITMDFPEYRRHNSPEVAILLPNLNVDLLVQAIRSLNDNPDLYHRLEQNCRLQAEVLNWENEKEKLLQFYAQFKD